MRVWVIGAALVLAGCSGEPSQDNVKKMLEANDPMVCASADVQRTVLNVYAAGYEDYIAAGGNPLVFEMVNSTGLNKDIHEVSCSASVLFPPMDFDIYGSVPALAVSVDFKVSPSLGSDGDFIVNATSQDDFLPYRIGEYIRMNSKVVEEKDQSQSQPQPEPEPQPQPSSANATAQEFTGAEAALIASANDAWVGYRNGEPDAEAKFDQLLDQLLKGGICWGEGDQPQAEYKFHRCGPNSIQKQ